MIVAAHNIQRRRANCKISFIIFPFPRSKNAPDLFRPSALVFFSGIAAAAAYLRKTKTPCYTVLFKYTLQISAKVSRQLFNISFRCIDKQVVVFLRAPFLLTEKLVILCSAAVNFSHLFLHLCFGQAFALRLALHTPLPNSRPMVIIRFMLKLLSNTDRLGGKS